MRKLIMSDLHLDHKHIDKLRPRNSLGEAVRKLTTDEIKTGIQPEPRMSTEEQHAATVEEILKLGKKDLLFLLGDCFFSVDSLKLLDGAKCRIILIGGNHDIPLNLINDPIRFDKIYGVIKHKRHWLSHAPIHPQELRGFKNIHGHLHWQLIVNENKEPDTRYKNVCMEYTGFKPVLWDYVISDEYDQECKKKWEDFKTKGLILPY